MRRPLAFLMETARTIAWDVACLSVAVEIEHRSDDGPILEQLFAIRWFNERPGR